MSAMSMFLVGRLCPARIREPAPGFGEFLGNKWRSKSVIPSTSSLRRVNAAGTHLLGLINEVLDVSKPASSNSIPSLFIWRAIHDYAAWHATAAVFEPG